METAALEDFIRCAIQRNGSRDGDGLILFQVDAIIGPPVGGPLPCRKAIVIVCDCAALGERPESMNTPDVAGRMKEFGKRVAFRTPGLRRLAAPSYRYCVEPAQLAWLVQAFDRTAHLDGSIAEIGVARGQTTVFLNEHLRRSGDSRAYFCIDTFKGFTARDIAYEGTRRGKRGIRYNEFGYNDADIFAANISRLGYPRVKCISGDVSALAPADLGPLSVSLVDVDLYLPTKAALALVWECLQPGGKVMVDDVQRGGKYDGAREALDEFANEHAIDWIGVGTNGGALEKPG